ncbi:hypothetical protein IM538_21490 [Cytobacillus suaedae]|nr:hypothetical protein IM538_21490 [Cytobacillus suaedae]
MIRFIKNMVEADKSNALAEKRNLQAFEKLSLADMQVNEQLQKTENALEKLTNRKKGILCTSFKNFLDLYQKIMQINFVESDGIKELSRSILALKTISSLKPELKITVKDLTTSQSMSAFFIKGGFSGVIAKEAEMNANYASIRNRSADVVLSQANTICVALEGIETRANKISELLARLNVPFRKSIETTSVILIENGSDRTNYSKSDKEKIMTCINLASTIKKIIDTTLIDQNGEITKESINAIQVGDDYLAKLNSLVNG